jgi:helix-turn-helix protein
MGQVTSVLYALTSFAARANFTVLEEKSSKKKPVVLALLGRTLRTHSTSAVSVHTKNPLPREIQAAVDDAVQAFRTALTTLCQAAAQSAPVAPAPVAPPPLPDPCTQAEVAKYLRVSRRTVYSLEHRGHLARVPHICRPALYFRSSVLEWAASPKPNGTNNDA